MAGSHWFQRHAALTVTVCALVGTLLGIALGLTYLPDPSSVLWAELARPGAGLVSAVAGMLLGLLAGILLIRVGRSGVECPRCGTLNAQDAGACAACGLPLA